MTGLPTGNPVILVIQLKRQVFSSLPVRDKNRYKIWFLDSTC